MSTFQAVDGLPLGASDNKAVCFKAWSSSLPFLATIFCFWVSVKTFLAFGFFATFFATFFFGFTTFFFGFFTAFFGTTFLAFGLVVFAATLVFGLATAGVFVMVAYKRLNGRENWERTLDVELLSVFLT